MSLELFRRIVRRPVISEKSTDFQEAGILCFEVDVKANKIEIKKAVEALFNVKVKHVRVMNLRGKMRRFNNRQGKSPDWKKAYVTLKKGERFISYEDITAQGAS